ncbi:hypothetical protein M1585_01305 [Candidatus Parvarchaeota archaeon]|nr:hypothetical protein [Candidatus Parvarchaeota archaeon]
MQETLFGRVISIRKYKTTIFADMYMYTNKPTRKQIMIAGNQKINFSVGDIIKVKGQDTITQKGLEALDVSNIEILSRSSISQPKIGKKHINKDKYKSSFYDALRGGRSIKLWHLRNDIISTIQAILIEKGFLQIYSPILANQRGTSIAEPFSTVTETGEIRYLRITEEINHKKIFAATLSALFEFGYVFRRMGTGGNHANEYLVVELIHPNWKLNDLIQLVSEIYNRLVPLVKSKNMELPSEFGKALSICTFDEVLKPYKERIGRYNPKLMNNKYELEEKHIRFDFFQKFIKPNINRPTIVYGYDIGSPLAVARGDKYKELELIMGGSGIGHGYEDEINYSILLQRFEQQQKALEVRGIKAGIDYTFLEAAKAGLPPSASLVIGIDRLVSYISNIEYSPKVIARLFL